MPFTPQDIAQGNYLVTGATGRTGSIVVQKLRDAGASVRALVHSTIPEEPVDGVQYVQGDYQDKESLLAATQGIDWVIACVGAQSATRGAHLIEGVEYQGTVNLTEAASETAPGTCPSSPSAAPTRAGIFTLSTLPRLARINGLSTLEWPEPSFAPAA